jgi:hypothetical protein
MDLQQLILIKIAEEAAEISKAALKASQFGLDDRDPATQVTNLDWLLSEYHDLQGVMTLLRMEQKNTVDRGLKLEATPWELREKLQKVCRWAKHSIEQNRLQLDEVPEWLRDFWDQS